MSIGDGRQGPHPDILPALCEHVNEVFLVPDTSEDHRLVAPVSPDQVTVRCQRTWHEVELMLPLLNDGSFTAGVAQFDNGGRLFSFFFLAARPANEPEFRLAGSSGGMRPREMRDRVGGFNLHGGYFTTVGGLGIVPDGGKIRVELADGTIYENQAVDNCCIVLAPSRSEPSKGDMITARYFDADGNEFGSDTVPIGGPLSNQ